MKRILVAIAALFLSGCASVSSPVPGLVYKDVSGPVSAGPNTGVSRVGSGAQTSILGIFAFGDASVEAAARNGAITKIDHVDYRAVSVLFFYAKYTVTVYGE